MLVHSLTPCSFANVHICVKGYDDKPRSSGYAIFRAWFDAIEQGVDKDPLTDYMTKNGDAFYGWIGELQFINPDACVRFSCHLFQGRDVHFLASSSKKGKALSWVITHKYVLPGILDSVNR